MDTTETFRGKSPDPGELPGDADVLAEPLAYPLLVLATVTVDDCPAASPDTVTRPLTSIDADPCVAVAFHVHAASKFVS